MGLYAKALIDTKVCDWPTLIERMTLGPARTISRDLGTLTVGATADITILDPKKRWTVRVDKFLSKSRNCPYDGWKLKGRPVTTLVAGEVRFQA